MLKILNSKIYRIIVFIIEGLLLVNIDIMLCLGKFGDNDPVNWTFFWINVIAVALIFAIDCIINGCNGKMIFINKRKEKGFQAIKYCYISLITSCAISVTMWLTRSIQYFQYNESGALPYLVMLLCISITVFCIFFYMIIMFIINNKLVLTNEEFYNNKDNEDNKRNRNNLLKF